MSRIRDLYESYFATYFPTPLFELLGLGQLSFTVVRLFGIILLVALLSAVCGFLTRLALTLAWISFFLYYGTVLGFEKPEPSTISPYTFHYNNIVVFILFVLSISPGISLWGIDGVRRRWRKERRLNTPQSVTPDESVTLCESVTTCVPAWPLLLIKLTLALAYFGSGLAKIKASGVLWMDGYTLQAYFLMKYLQEDASVGFWLAQYYWVCVLLSCCTLVLELSFIIIPFFPNRHLVTWVYFVAGLGFHTLIAITMKIRHFLPFMGLSYLIFLDWQIWQKSFALLWPLALQKEKRGDPLQLRSSHGYPKHDNKPSWRLWVSRCFIIGYLSTLLFCDVLGIELWPFSDYAVFRGRFHYTQVQVWQIRGVDDANCVHWLQARDLGPGFEGWFDGTNFIRFYMAHSGRATRMLTLKENEDLAREGPRFLRDFHQHLPSVLRERFHALEFVVRSIEREPQGWLIPSDRVLFSTSSTETEKKALLQPSHCPPFRSIVCNRVRHWGTGALRYDEGVAKRRESRQETKRQL